MGYPRGICGLKVYSWNPQEAQRTYVDEHAPVEKQRAKRFNLKDELERIKEHHLQHEYENKPVARRE
jgi:hypothetical protein